MNRKKTQDINGKLKQMFRHHDGYLKRYVIDAVKKGFYIEAICRLDAILDELAITLLKMSNSESIHILTLLDHTGSLKKEGIIQALSHTRIIKVEVAENYRELKDCRNKIVHKVHGEFEVALQESGFRRKKNFCVDCYECNREDDENKSKHCEKILMESGEKNWEEYSKKILKKKIRMGIKTYKAMKNALKAFIKRKNEPKP